MKCHLILQWPTVALSNFDDLIEIEDHLIANLAPDAEVDGHDAGKGEVNIFILTADARLTFDQAKNLLQQLGRLDDLRAAYREERGEAYILLWPIGIKEFHVR